jgi:hypothetical protein
MSDILVLTRVKSQHRTVLVVFTGHIRFLD